MSENIDAAKDQHDLLYCQLAENSRYHEYRNVGDNPHLFYCVHCLQQVMYTSQDKWVIVRKNLTK